MIKTKNDFNADSLSYLKLIRGDKEGVTSLSIRAYGVYSYLVDQEGYPNNQGVTNKQIAARTGLDYSGIKKTLEELEKFGLLLGNTTASKHFPKCPSPEMWSTYFSSIKDQTDWLQTFAYDRLYIRRLDSGLSFNQAVVFSQLVAWRKEHNGKEIVQSTTYTGLSKKCRLCRKTIVSIIEELKSLDLIMVYHSDNSFAVWIPELNERTRKFFLHKGDKNQDQEMVQGLFAMINGDIIPKGEEADLINQHTRPVEANFSEPSDYIHEEILENVVGQAQKQTHNDDKDYVDVEKFYNELEVSYE